MKITNRNGPKMRLGVSGLEFTLFIHREPISRTNPNIFLTCTKPISGPNPTLFLIYKRHFHNANIMHMSQATS